MAIKGKGLTKRITDAERILGCIRGKAIGGTLGTPHEGKMDLLSLTYYDPVPHGVLPNDDFDIQLLFLEAVEASGGRVEANMLARAWLERMTFPFDEYGVATLNLKRGLLPPLTGTFDNPFLSCMGSPIRSELWALLAPGRPALAAWFALQDSIIDHGLESAAGEMFFSAFESLAFAGEKDFRGLAEQALRYTPPATETAKALRFTLDKSRKLGWVDLRQAILDRFGSPNFTEAPQNIAFTIIGLLYFPDDFEKALLATTNCGYDTDCTAATIGAIWGLVKGDRFPPRWTRPIGTDILASHGVWDLAVEKPAPDLARHVMRVRKLVEKWYKGWTENKADSEIKKALSNPNRFQVSGTALSADYSTGPVFDKKAIIRISGPFGRCHAVWPFQARKKGTSIEVSVDPTAETLPSSVRLTVEDGKGNPGDIRLLTPHELWVGRVSGSAGFNTRVTADLTTLAGRHMVKPYDRNDRTFFLKELPGKGWVHLAGIIHIHVFDQYKLCVFAECPVTSFLDGALLHKVGRGWPCIPAPHRGQKAAFVQKLDLRPGWHRWDIFLDKKRAIRSGKVVVTLAQAFSSRLVEFRFRRRKEGVYSY